MIFMFNRGQSTLLTMNKFQELYKFQNIAVLYVHRLFWILVNLNNCGENIVLYLPSTIFIRSQKRQFPQLSFNQDWLTYEDYANPENMILSEYGRKMQ